MPKGNSKRSLCEGILLRGDAPFTYEVCVKAVSKQFCIVQSQPEISPARRLYKVLHPTLLLSFFIYASGFEIPVPYSVQKIHPSIIIPKRVVSYSFPILATIGFRGPILSLSHSSLSESL